MFRGRVKTEFQDLGGMNNDAFGPGAIIGWLKCSLDRATIEIPIGRALMQECNNDLLAESNPEGGESDASGRADVRFLR
jgi:hypothetical protein